MDCPWAWSVWCPDPLHLIVLFEHASHRRSRSDAPKHVWGQWWVHRSIVLEGQIHWHDINIIPTVADFASIPPMNLSLPWSSSGLTFNLLVIAHLFQPAPLHGLLSLVKDHRAAVVAGAAFSCAPFVMAHGLSSGVSEGIFLFPLPLIVLCMLRMATRDSWKYPIWVAGFWSFRGLGSWHYGVGWDFDLGQWGCWCCLNSGIQVDQMRTLRTVEKISFLWGFCFLIGFFVQVQSTVGASVVYQRGLLSPDGLPKPELVGRQLNDPYIDLGNPPWPAENVLSLVDPILPTSAGLHVDQA